VLPRTRRRVVEHVAHAERTGAAAVLVTCSSIGEAAELSRPYVGIPVYRVDVPMAAEAVATGRRIGVLATLESTLDPTRRLIERAAQAAGRAVELSTSVCPGAFAALRAGDSATHDEIVAAEVARLAGDADVLVLAQASMARIVTALGDDGPKVPVLTSPESGVRQLADVVGSSR
jgi:Asp/Glu/hydantoin racemase